MQTMPFDTVVLKVVNPGSNPSVWGVLFHRGETIDVGRGSNNDVVISNAYLSRKHLSLSWQGDGLTLKDLNSRNGTKVNGERIVGARGLMIGDTMRMGSATVEVVSANDKAVAALTLVEPRNLGRHATIEANDSVQAMLGEAHAQQRFPTLSRRRMQTLAFRVRAANSRVSATDVVRTITILTACGVALLALSLVVAGFF